MSKNRDRAWRRQQREKYIQRRMGRYPSRRRWKPHGKDKRWKMAGSRSSKIHRARQLGFDYEDPGRHNWRLWLLGSLEGPPV